ncbi:205_t:CDS:2 [Paraglomus occultum]|uniref:205_t:CDS:1 n=1 Tax=Paraglomus occultum TaxID=144539 RepID=A0A9N8ZVG4_9GLOM|nr:205_t:CDS:2 [Paraglomus occultum]
MLVNIKDIYQKAQELSQLEEKQRLEEINKLEKIKVGGWVKSIRESKEKIFIALNDGSTTSPFQIIISRKNFSQTDLLEQINFASSLLVSGKLRSQISWAIHQFFQQEGFYYIHTPLITANDTEGAGELFTATTRYDKQYEKDFFRKKAKLTVSGQLQAEALAQGLAENLLKHVIEEVIKNNLSELNYLEKYHQKELTNELKKISNLNFPRLTYAECLEILAFYMKNNPDGRTVACFDLLFPQVGEMIGGSMREDNYQVLREKARKIGLDLENMNWYLSLRKYGYAPSGGFGLGLERLIMFISGTENIRDTIAFPRFPGKLEF